MSEVTQILVAIQNGDRACAEQLLPLVYDELRRLAAEKLSHERSGQTLQPTALVHEAYLRLVGNQTSAVWDSQGHFFAAAAEAMRRILIEAARSRQSQKRGGQLARQPFDESQAFAPALTDEVLALDEALEKFAQVDPPAAQVVSLRYFAGLSIPEVAGLMGLSPRTTDRHWAYARAWLHQELQSGSGVRLLHGQPENPQAS